MKSGHKCPDFERSFDLERLKSGVNERFGRSKSGHMVTTRTFEIRTIRNPDVFLSGLPNRTSGIRRFTVFSQIFYMIKDALHIGLVAIILVRQS